MNCSQSWNTLGLDQQKDILVLMFASFEKPWTDSLLTMVSERFRIHDAQVSYYDTFDSPTHKAYSIWWMNEHFVYLDKMFVVPECKRHGLGSEWFRTWTRMLTPLPVVLRTSEFIASGFYAKLDMHIIAINNDQVYMTNHPSFVSASMVNSLFSLPSCFTQVP